jgi:protein O-GlcNAc transferase
VSKKSVKGKKPEGAIDPHQTLLEAVALHQRGRLMDARALYERALQAEPENSDALHLLGVCHYQAGHNEEAIELISRAIRIDPLNPSFHDNLAAVLLAARQPEKAELSYMEAARLVPYSVEAHLKLGNTRLALEKLDEAAQSYRRALVLDPSSAGAHFNLGIVLAKQDRLKNAEESYRKALECAPGFVEAYYNLGDVLRRQGQLGAACDALDRAIALKPDYAEALNNRGSVLKDMRQYEAALASFERAIALNPDNAVAHLNRGDVLSRQKRMEEAIESYSRAIALDANCAEAYYGRGIVLYDLGRQQDALADCGRALAVRPDYAKARWMSALFTIPNMPLAPEDIQHARQQFPAALAALDEWFDDARIEHGFEAAANMQPFFLAYQEEDNKPLLARFGALCCRLMEHWQKSRGFRCAEKIPPGRVKVGIVSTHIRSHSVWDALIKGWVRHLDADRFELQLYYLGSKHDEETELAKSKASVFVEGCSSLSEWVEAILRHAPAVLIYPEIGMWPLTAKLASMRLAPIQMASWGHPETTGLPTMDYYLSAEDLEPEGAANYYTETLVKLPHLGSCYQRASVSAQEPDWDAFGLRRDAPLLLCPGTPFKYAPKYDYVWMEICKRLKRCQLVFFSPPRDRALADNFKARLGGAFSNAGMELDKYVVFIPWLSKPEFYGLMQRADVFLDTIGFSGFNTAIQAVECALPIVTREGRFMRGRLAGGILEKLGLKELIAPNEEEYINLAVKLAEDKEYRAVVRARMESARGVLFDDVESVRALERFIIERCAESR